jgi:hypothetical protein
MRPVTPFMMMPSVRVATPVLPFIVVNLATGVAR